MIIGDEGAIALGVALHHNTTIPTLDLSYNNIGAEGGYCAGGRATPQYYISYTFVLNLSWNGIIGAEGATALAIALHHDTTITTLHLSFNNIGVEGATALGVALHHNTTLTTLDLIIQQHWS